MKKFLVALTAALLVAAGSATAASADCWSETYQQWYPTYHWMHIGGGWYLVCQPSGYWAGPYQPGGCGQQCQ